MKRIPMTLAVAAAMLTGAASAVSIRVKATVVDEDTGEPVEGVTLTGQFAQEQMNPFAIFKGGAKPNYDSATTGKDGTCTLWDSSNLGAVYVNVTDVPRGYYLGGGGYCEVKESSFLLPVTVRKTFPVQRIINPIPLCARWVGENYDLHKDGVFDIAGGSPGFDLLMGDWLPPAGTGVTADVVFTEIPQEFFLTDSSGKKHYKSGISIRFVGEDNGMCPVQFSGYREVKIRVAPESGYDLHSLDSLEETDECGCKKSNWDNIPKEEGYYAFRIRTKRDEDGKLVDAYYGKIYYGLGIIRTWDAGMHKILRPTLCYFLNPTPLDRNLEWSKENLFRRPKGEREPSGR